MNMANASPNARVANATYIPPTRVGSMGARVGGVCIGSVRVFGYQHVGIGNAKVSRWGYSPTQSPHASSFLLELNIGFSQPRHYKPPKVLGFLHKGKR